MIEPGPSCCLTTRKHTCFQCRAQRHLTTRVQDWTEDLHEIKLLFSTPCDLRWETHVIVLTYFCISIHSYIFSTCQDSLQEKAAWWASYILAGYFYLCNCPSYYDADIPSKWLLQVGNSHVHLSHCLYKCLLHCCSIMSLRKTSVSAWADIRWHSGMSCDQIVWRTMFPISRVKPFSISPGKEKSTCKHEHHVLASYQVFIGFSAILTSNLCTCVCKRIRYNNEGCFKDWAIDRQTPGANVL